MNDNSKIALGIRYKLIIVFENKSSGEKKFLVFNNVLIFLLIFYFTLAPTNSSKINYCYYFELE